MLDETMLCQVKRKRLLSIAHFHPDLVRGGGQQAAYELFKGFDARADYDAFFIGAVQGDQQRQLVKPGVFVCRYDGRPNEFLLAGDGFDPFWLSNTTLSRGAWRDVSGLLRALRPDVIHFNHVVHAGTELLRLARVVCPQARIVYTLHEFTLICHANGQMVRTRNQGLCDGASPTRCALCFPDRRPAEFFLRDRWLRAHFACVDRFVAPSRFLRQRYIEWGIAAEDIVLIDYGRTTEFRRPPNIGPASEKRNRFGFFGQLIDCKGLDCLIDAVALLVRQGIIDFELRVHGANLEFASEALQQKFSLAIETFTQIKFYGSYSNHAGPRHAAAVDWFLVPSIWWENSPLVIQEAFMARRPVVCGNIGGMAEKVRDKIDGLHFAVGDAAALADTMRRCISEPGLWDRLAANIPDILSVEDAVEQHRELCFEGELQRSVQRQLWEARWADSAKAEAGSNPSERGRGPAFRWEAGPGARQLPTQPKV
jgi:glycosyltransferase involved in cell wall biosynthesis